MIISFTGIYVVDSLMGILIGGIILRSAFGLLSESGMVLLEAVPGEINPEDVVAEITKVKGVESIHDMHLWSISSGINAMSGHVVIQDQMVSDSGEVLAEITRVLEEKFNILHTTLQLECRMCTGPFVCGLASPRTEEK